MYQLLVSLESTAVSRKLKSVGKQDVSGRSRNETRSLRLRTVSRRRGEIINDVGKMKEDRKK